MAADPYWRRKGSKRPCFYPTGLGERCTAHLAPRCLLRSQDPAIKAMAEQIANDPSFKEVTKSLQESMGGLMAGAPRAPGPAPGAAPPDMSQLDPSKYMEAMSSMFQNKNFMEMAEKLGKTIIEVRTWEREPAARFAQLADPIRACCC